VIAHILSPPGIGAEVLIVAGVGVNFSAADMEKKEWRVELGMDAG